MLSKFSFYFILKLRIYMILFVIFKIFFVLMVVVYISGSRKLHQLYLFPSLATVSSLV